MTRQWVDPECGWKYGFPKIWDSEKEPNMKAWLEEEGYPGKAAYVRMWDVEEEDYESGAD